MNWHMIAGAACAILSLGFLGIAWCLGDLARGIDRAASEHWADWE